MTLAMNQPWSGMCIQQLSWQLAHQAPSSWLQAVKQLTQEKQDEKLLMKFEHQCQL